jgi:hypothetical protein
VITLNVWLAHDSDWGEIFSPENIEVDYDLVVATAGSVCATYILSYVFNTFGGGGDGYGINVPNEQVGSSDSSVEYPQESPDGICYGERPLVTAGPCYGNFTGQPLLSPASTGDVVRAPLAAASGCTAQGVQAYAQSAAFSEFSFSKIKYSTSAPSSTPTWTPLSTITSNGLQLNECDPQNGVVSGVSGPYSNAGFTMDYGTSPYDTSCGTDLCYFVLNPSSMPPTLDEGTSATLQFDTETPESTVPEPNMFVATTFIDSQDVSNTCTYVDFNPGYLISSGLTQISTSPDVCNGPLAGDGTSIEDWVQFSLGIVAAGSSPYPSNGVYYLPTQCTPTGSLGPDCLVLWTSGYIKSIPLVVIQDPTVISITASRSSVDVNQPVVWTASIAGGMPSYTYYWSTSDSANFPCFQESDGYQYQCTPSSGAAGLNEYVSLYVEDSDNCYSGNPGICTASAVSSPTITPFPDPYGSYPANEPVSVLYSNSVFLSVNANSGTGTYTNFVWSGLPFGCSSTAQSFICKPTDNPGPYQISVSFTDSNNFPVTLGSFTFTVYSETTSYYLQEGASIVQMVDSSDAQVPAIDSLSTTVTLAESPYPTIYAIEGAIEISGNSPAKFDDYTIQIAHDWPGCAAGFSAQTYDWSYSGSTTSERCSGAAEMNAGDHVTLTLSIDTSTHDVCATANDFYNGWTFTQCAFQFDSQTSTNAFALIDSKTSMLSNGFSGDFTGPFTEALANDPTGVAAFGSLSPVTYETLEGSRGGTIDYVAQYYGWWQEVQGIQSGGTQYTDAVSSRITQQGVSGQIFTPLATSTIKHEVMSEEASIIGPPNGASYFWLFVTDVVPPFIILTTLSPSAHTMDVGQSESIDPVTSGGVGPFVYYWYINGLYSSNTTGPLTFTPVVAGNYTIQEYTLDTSSNDSFGQTTSVTIVVSSPLVVFPPTASPQSVTPLATTTFEVTVAGGSGGYAYSWNGLPTGCSSSNTMSLICTPTATGTFLVAVLVSDSNGFSITSANLIFEVYGDGSTHLQEGSSIAQMDNGNTAGFYAWYLTATLTTSPYPTEYGFVGLTNTGDSYEVAVGYNWPDCNSGFEMLYTWGNAAGSTIGTVCDPTAVLHAGDSVALDLSVSSSGSTSGDVCMDLYDPASVTTPTATDCVAQPDGGSAPSQNWFVPSPTTLNPNGYFTGPETQAISNIVCPSFSSMPTVTYQWASGIQPTEYSIWSQEYQAGGATCSSYASPNFDPTSNYYSTTYVQAAPVDGPHWEGAQDISNANNDYWWQFTTDATPTGVTLTNVTTSQRAADVGQTVTYTPTVGGGTAPYSCYWYLDNVYQFEDCAGATFTPGAPGVYTIEEYTQDASGNTYGPSNPVTTVVTSDPTVTRPTASPSSVDVGQIVTFTTTTSGGSGGNTITWIGLPTGCSSASSLTVTCAPNASGTFSVEAKITDSNGYVVTSSALTFTVYGTLGVTYTAYEYYWNGYEWVYDFQASCGGTLYSYQNYNVMIEFVVTPTGGAAISGYTWNAGSPAWYYENSNWTYETSPVSGGSTADFAYDSTYAGTTITPQVTVTDANGESASYGCSFYLA